MDLRLRQRNLNGYDPDEAGAQAQLEEYARWRGQDPAVALDEALASYLEWERQDFAEAVEGIRQGHEDVKAGRTRSAAEFLADMQTNRRLRGRRE